MTVPCWLPKRLICPAAALLAIVYFPCLSADSRVDGGTLAIPRTVEHKQRPITSTDLVAVREVGGVSGTGLSVSHDGSYVAFEMHQADLARDNYRVAWFVAEATQDGPITNVGDAGEAEMFRAMSDDGTTNGHWTTEAAKWSADNEWVLYRRSIKGEIELWASRRDGTSQIQLTDGDADVQAFEWSPDYSKIYYTTNGERIARRRLIEHGDEHGYLFDGTKPWSVLDARPFQARYNVTSGRPELDVYEWNTGVQRAPTHQEVAEFERSANGIAKWLEARDARIVAFAKEGTVVAWAEPAIAARNGLIPPLTLYRADLSKSGRPIRAMQCLLQECTSFRDGFPGYGVIADGLLFDEDGTNVYFVDRESITEDRSVLYAWDTKENSIRRVFSTHDWLSGCLRAHDQAICYLQTANRPRRIVSIGLQDGAMTTLVDPNPEFAAFWLGDVQRIELRDEHGHPTYGNLVLPLGYDAETRYPLILVGYRPKRTARGGTGNEYPIHVFAANGFAVFVYNAYDDPEAEATLSDPKEIFARYWGDDLIELNESLSVIKAITSHLHRNGIVDSRRIGMTGFSTGASYAAYALIHSDLITAASMSSVQWPPIGYYLTPSGRDWRSFLKRIGFGPIGTPEARHWTQVALSHNVDKVMAPLLINAADTEHPGAIQTVVTYLDAGKPIEMHVYPDEFHVKWHPRHLYHIYERNVDWFNFWLRCVEDPDPNKREQYTRWRDLRERHFDSLQGDYDKHQKEEFCSEAP